MDCPAEEHLIRFALGSLSTRLHFDLAARRLGVEHRGPVGEIQARLAALAMGAELLAKGGEGPATASSAPDRGSQTRVLVWLLAINGAMFVLEGLVGWWADSSGLLADALDMFADAAVYGSALYAVGRGRVAQISAARLAGVLQLILALGLFWQVGRHIVLGAEPLGLPMMVMSLLALAANLACLALIAPHQDGGVHLKASYIFSANDVLANLGVMVAGALVWWTGAQWPDWLVGSLIGLLVLAGAVRILRLGGQP